MKLKPYPKYKPSGVEWLGDVPEHWEVKRLKYSLALNTKKAESQKNPIALENIESWTGRYIETESEFEGDGVYFQCGDILFGKLRPYLAKVYLAEQNGEAVGDLFVLRPSEVVVGKYASYLLRTRNYIEVIDGSTYGSKMPRASWDFMSSLPILIPSVTVQKVIINFLDRETGKIDELIAKNEQLIERLKEKRTALISRAVTKGLNPNVRLKPSGVEWLGNIPETWKVKAVWHIYYLGRGRVISNEDIADNPGNYPVYSSQTENDGNLGCLGNYDFEGDYITWTTDGANAGTVFRRKGKFNCTNVCGTLHAKRVEDVDNGFVSYALLLATGEFVRHDINPKLMNNVMAKIRFALPSISEQSAIAEYLDCETKKIDALAGKVQMAIEKLKEYRAALISAAVTGKIDVREEVS